METGLGCPCTRARVWTADADITDTDHKKKKCCREAASDDGGRSGRRRGLRLRPRLIKVAESLPTGVHRRSQQTDQAKAAAVRSKPGTILQSTPCWCVFRSRRSFIYLFISLFSTSALKYSCFACAHLQCRRPLLYLHIARPTVLLKEPC